MNPSPTQWREVYLCVALTTMATLLLELSLTRIFSVVFYYHFAFLAISIALFGLGLGGVFSYVAANWKAPLFTRLGRLSMVNSLLVVVALVVILQQKNTLSNWDLALIYFTTALPFFVSGTIVSLAIGETIQQVNRVYFFDLLGAAGGCLLLLQLLDLVGGPGTVMAAAVTLGRIGPSAKEAVPALVKYLAHNEVLVRWAAAEALGTRRPVAPRHAPRVPAISTT